MTVLKAPAGGDFRASIELAFYPISVMGAVLDTGHILGGEEGETFVRRTMHEVCAIAANLQDEHAARLR